MLEKTSRILTLSSTIKDDTVASIIESLYRFSEEDEEILESIIPEKADIRPIKLIINSYGGEVHAGLALIGAIEMSIAPVHTYVIGKAMSMALCVAVAGHERYAHDMATYMYHEVSYGALEKMEGHKRALKENERIQKLMDKLIVDRTKIPHDKIKQESKEDMRDWYFGASEALKLNVCDFVLARKFPRK